MPRGGGESCDIGDHPAADSHDDVAPGEAVPREAANQGLDRGQRLRCLAVADEMDLDVVVGQRDLQRDAALGHHGHAPRRRREQTREFSDGTLTDDHVVGAIGERDVHAQHRSTAFATS